MPPVEVIELQPTSGRPPGKSVQLVPAGTPVEVIEVPRARRLQLIVGLQLAPGSQPGAVVLASARFISAILTSDRKLRLSIDPAQSRVAAGEITLAFTPAPLGVDAAERLKRLVGVVREAATVFEGAQLTRVEFGELV
jgi:hypothetical protein